MRLSVFIFLLCIAVAGWGQVPVWIDTDPSMAPGGHEVDDGIALVQAFASREIQIRGVSVVFGNADLATASRIAKEFVGKFGPGGLSVYFGAGSAGELGRETAASMALAAALRRERLTILVLGPATNVATVLKNHPELGERVEAVIAVAGRRPGQRFVAGPAQKVPFRDLNFELDPEAFAVLLASKVPITLAPWEISSQVWITEDEVRKASRRSAAMEWMLPALVDWIAFWEKQFGAHGFNPFDALAVGAVVDRKDLICSLLGASIETAASDTAVGTKPYLLVRAVDGAARRVTYCHDVRPDFKKHLLRRLGERRRRQ